MCESSPLELQTTELECLFSTFKDSDIHVSLKFDEGTREGWISVYSELVDGQRIHLHGCDTSIVPRNTEKLTDGDSVVYLLKSLPPIRVNFIFQNEYPGTVSRPVSLEFSVESTWLPKRILDRVYERLNEIVHTNPGELVLWQFIDFLRNEAVYCIVKCEDRLSKVLDLNLDVLYEECGEEMELSISECTEMLLLNNDDRFDVEFEIGTWDCPVCCESKNGSLFYRFPKCRHAVCLECVNEYFLGVINDGMMSQQLGCLQCGEEAGPSEARAVLSAEDYARFEALQLKRGLSMMRDIGTCPRPGCNTSVILDDPNLGRCPKCKLAFCPHCLRTYHGVAKCFMFDNQAREPEESEETIEPIEPEEIADVSELVTEPTKPWYTAGRTKYDKKRIRQEERSSSLYIKANCRYCPACNAKCEKDGGCNHMECYYCHAGFCWACMQVIGDVSSHFRPGGCPRWH